MSGVFKKALIMIFVLFVTAPLYAEDPPTCPVTAVSYSFSEWVNAKSKKAPVDKKEEQKTLREYWENTLGMDIFYPYFKAKEVEEKVSEKTTVSIMRLKGKAQFTDDSLKIIFRSKF